MITWKLRRFDVITTLLLRHVFSGELTRRCYVLKWLTNPWFLAPLHGGSCCSITLGYPWSKDLCHHDRNFADALAPSYFTGHQKPTCWFHSDYGVMWIMLRNNNRITTLVNKLCSREVGNPSVSVLLTGSSSYNNNALWRMPSKPVKDALMFLLAVPINHARTFYPTRL